tara:strand:+ start:125 stop:565 length:441 start_codon:yes stop_codon:yes gene_type:complete
MAYETKEDQDNERFAMDLFMAKASIPGVAIPCPEFYEVDYMIAASENTGSPVTALAEVKCRNNTSLEYPSYMISLHKALALYRWGKACGVPAYLVVRWTDSIGYLDVAAYRLPLRPIGVATRHGRRSADTEPGWFITKITDHFLFV